jgi:hypothetical protein
MSILDGKLVPSFETHCPICERAALGLGRTKREAEKMLRKHGLREHMSLGWICCSPKPHPADEGSET